MTDDEIEDMLTEADQQSQCEVQSDRNVRLLVAEVRRLRQALNDVAQSMATAEMVLRTPDMGGTYIRRARELLRERMRAHEALR